MNLWQRAFSSVKNDSPVKDRPVLALQIGDTVSHDLMDYLVTGQVTYYNNSGSSWTDYELEGDDHTWLVFEKEANLVAIYKPADIDLNGKLPKQIKYYGTVFGLCESGTAGIGDVNDQTLNNSGASIKYWQYKEPTGNYVIYVEDGSGKRSVSWGYYIRPHELRLIRKFRAI